MMRRLVAAFLLACGSSVWAADRPNILLLISDDHRWDALGAAGNAAIHTPQLDRLAAAGVYLWQATIHVPQCSPSRASLLTGLPPHRHRWYSNQFQDPAVAAPDGFNGLPLLPGLLRQRGYRTVLTGKWHLAPDPGQCGFSLVRTWLPQGGAAYVDVHLARGDSRDPQPTKGYLQHVLADDVIDFLNSPAAHQQPFFYWVAFTAPHLPYGPNPPHIQQLYLGKEPRELLPPGFPNDIPTNDWRRYYEAVSFLDEQIGRILDALDRAGLQDNTVVVFLGDNGYMMGHKGVGVQGGTGKVVPYEGSVRVPLIIRAPGIARLQGRCEAPVSSLDLPVTILTLAGMAPPHDWPGRDLLPLLRGKPNHGIDHAVCEWADEHSDRFGHLAYRLVRTPRFKLIVWKDPHRTSEFYDLAADPLEQHNRIDDSALAGTRDDLHSKLERWMQQTEDPATSWPH
ncbi:MAG: sulfatase-like hydrolase/transferase [Pirellulales bacterium]|nr:sulfatase-like hydrolase/transferase [Pirellulales bacterium]